MLQQKCSLQHHIWNFQTILLIFHFPAVLHNKILQSESLLQIKQSGISPEQGEKVSQLSSGPLHLQNRQEPNVQISTQYKAPQTEYVTSVEDHLMTYMSQEMITSSWSMGSPAGFSQSSCSGSLSRSDKQWLNLISDVCLLPGYHETFGIHPYHPVKIVLPGPCSCYPSITWKRRKERTESKGNTSLILLQSFLENLSFPAFICLCSFTSLTFTFVFIWFLTSFCPLSLFVYFLNLYIFKLSFDCLSSSSSFLWSFPDHSVLSCVLVILYVLHSFHVTVTFSSPPLSFLSFSVVATSVRSRSP